MSCFFFFLTNHRISNLQDNFCLAIYLPSDKPSKSDEQDMLGTAEKVDTNSLATFSIGHSYVGRAAKIYIYQLCADTGCRLEDLLRTLAGRDGR